MNEQGRSLLVVQCKGALSGEARQRVFEAFKPVVQAAGLELILHDESTTVQVHTDQTPLLEALQRQTEAMDRHTQVLTALVAAMAGEMVAEDDTPRAVGLNGRPAL